MSFTQFYDIVGANASRVPLVKGTLVAYYNTGSGIVPETQAQINAAKAAGMGVALIDQAPGNPLFAEGLSDISDYENGAQTLADVIAGVKARSANGWKSTVYVSYSSLNALETALRDAGCNMSQVFYGVADYSWSLAEAEKLLNANPSWAYVQFGDNVTNANTTIPGTTMTCGQAGCDIDVAQGWWADQFLHPVPTPWPAPTGLTANIVNTFATKGYITCGFTWNAVPGATSYQGEILQVSTKNVVLYFQVSGTAVSDISLIWETEYAAFVQAHPTSEHTATRSQTVFFTTPNPYS